jgi:hypothetical protein
MTDDWGPLAPLIGEWAGESGLDTAYSHSQARVIDTPYREELSMKPFGPVANGRQVLFGLDYRSTMWPIGQDLPFHTEVGYWLWDAAGGEVLRGFVVPRGITVLAGGRAATDAARFELRADNGASGYGIGENRYLAAHASSVSYEATITIASNDEWSYQETTMLRMDELDEPLPHADRNTLRRTA